MKNVPIDNNSLAHTSWNCKYYIVWEYEICIPKPRILVQGILRRYRGEKYKSNKDVHIRTIEEG